MTPTNADRTRASKLRKRRALGKIEPAQLEWLRSYEARQTIRRAKALPAAGKHTPTFARPAKPDETLASRVHRTEPVTDKIDPGATWEPVATAAPEGTEPPAPGTTPPAAGTPLVDAPTPAVPVVDTAAADQFAGLVGFLVGFGMDAARSELADAPIPPEVRALLASDEASAKALGVVTAAAHRVALKYGFTSAPLADEAIVVGAVLGSGALVVRQAKRKRLAAAKERAPEAEKRKDPPKAPASALDALWEST